MSKKIIAVAVASIVAAPAAYGDISAYGRINNKLVFSENEAGDDVQNMTTSGSRFGFKGSGDLGNGMSAFARYEFATTTDHAQKGDSGMSNRLSFVGLSGPFGSVKLGQMWSAYFSNYGTHASLNFHVGPGQIGPGRVGNTIQYSNQFGPVSLTLDARVDDENDGGRDARSWSRFNGNGFGGGVTITPSDNFKLAAAFDSSEGSSGMDDKGAYKHEDTDTVGIAAVASFGGVTLTVGHEQQEKGDVEETNKTMLWVGSNLTDQFNLKVGFGQAETEKMGMDDVETDETAVLGIYNLGGGLKLWGQFYEADNDDQMALGVRLDF